VGILSGIYCSWSGIAALVQSTSPRLVPTSDCSWSGIAALVQCGAVHCYHVWTVVGRESPLWYNQAQCGFCGGFTVVGRESPLWYNRKRLRHIARRTVVGRESPLWYNGHKLRCSVL